MTAQKGNTYWRLAKGFAVGREKKYTPGEVWNKAVEYFKYFEDTALTEKVVSCGKIIAVERPRAMKIKAFCIFAEIDPTTFRNYEKDEAYLPIITRIKDIIYCQKFEGAAVGIFNGNIIAKELGLNDKADTDSDGFDPMKPITVVFGKGNLNAPKKTK